MRSMNISVMPREEGSKIPISVAGSMLVDIQNLLSHIGQYLIMKELKLQNRADDRLNNMFDLFIDPVHGVSLGTSAMSSSGIVDDALALMERTLIGMGSGAGGYWVDDTFTDPRFRRMIVKDIIKLTQDLRSNEGFYLRFSADSMFDNVDVGKLQDYLGMMQMAADDATCGVIRHVESKSGRADGMRLDSGDERIRMTFLTPEAEEDAAALADRPAIVAGRIKYSNGRLSEVADIGKVVPLERMKFRRMISHEGDVSLAEPLHIAVDFDHGKNEWTLRNDDLGMNVSKGTWDDAMAAFHDYFMFLFNTYSADDGTELSDEELEIRECILSLVAAP